MQQRTAELEIANLGLVQARDLAEAANRTKRAFLANMSRDIRTPMNANLGMASLLRRGDLTPQQSPRLDHIDTAAQHLLQIINLSKRGGADPLGRSRPAGADRQRRLAGD